MNPYDKDAVQAVWQRVLGTQETEDAWLTELIAREAASCRAYRALATCAGRFAPTFFACAREEQCHAVRLKALYALLYGKTPRLPEETVDLRRKDFRSALRECYAAEQRAAEHYRRTAERQPEQRELFLRMAEDERRHACRIHCVMTQLLHG